MTAIFRAGAARVNITPPIGVPQAGYGARDRCSDTVDDELFGKALVLDDGDREIALITTDLIGLTPEFVKQLCSLIQARTEIPPEHVLACASHTHFGPALKRLEYLPEAVNANFAKSYVDNLIRLLAGAVRRAHDTRQPARVGWGVGQAPELVFNRRTKKADGKVVMSWRMPPKEETAQLTFGPTDPDVGALRVEGTDRQLIAALINFACHPVCGVDRMYAISADYPGYAMQLVELIEGGICMFALGCAGNIVPIEREGRARQWIGRALGAEALKILQQVPMRDHAELSVANAKVELPLKPLSEVEKAQQGVATESDSKATVTTEVQAIRIGDLTLVGLPGEVFVEIGLGIKRNWTDRSGCHTENRRHRGIETTLGHPCPVFAFSLCNDSLAYVPVATAYEEGGYEPEWTKLGPGAGEILIQTAGNLLQSIRDPGE